MEQVIPQTPQSPAGRVLWKPFLSLVTCLLSLLKEIPE